jgi:hypothetical protein
VNALVKKVSWDAENPSLAKAGRSSSWDAEAPATVGSVLRSASYSAALTGRAATRKLRTASFDERKQAQGDVVADLLRFGMSDDDDARDDARDDKPAGWTARPQTNPPPAMPARDYDAEAGGGALDLAGRSSSWDAEGGNSAGSSKAKLSKLRRLKSKSADFEADAFDAGPAGGGDAWGSGGGSMLERATREPRDGGARMKKKRHVDGDQAGGSGSSLRSASLKLRSLSWDDEGSKPVRNIAEL